MDYFTAILVSHWAIIVIANDVQISLNRNNGGEGIIYLKKNKKYMDYLEKYTVFYQE